MGITGSAPVERKVTASSVAAFVASAGLLAVLTAVQENNGLVGGLPDAVEPVVLALVPTAVTFVSGWMARHTPRADADAAR
ncbi:hypothetical protein GCM10009801_69810 [Streptomyces albiaxialis]|uniref:Holin n=1 Tax=Streptomyces albiaxialis TaxID=329523 RepID=A0ABN2WU33_9ACTN